VYNNIRNLPQNKSQEIRELNLLITQKEIQYQYLENDIESIKVRIENSKEDEK
jgi:hypothetical protein